MISNIHKTVINEIKGNKPRHEILNDLMVSFCALALNEIKSTQGIVREVITDYAMKKLEFSFRLISNYQNVFDETDECFENLEERESYEF